MVILRAAQAAHDALHVFARDLEQRGLVFVGLHVRLAALRRVRQDDGVAHVLADIADKQRADHDDHGQRRENEHQQRPPVFLVLLRRPSPSLRVVSDQTLKSAGFSTVRPKCHKIACTMRSLAWPSP